MNIIKLHSYRCCVRQAKRFHPAENDIKKALIEANYIRLDLMLCILSIHYE
jgi:hypothetical protein